MAAMHGDQQQLLSLYGIIGVEYVVEKMLIVQCQCSQIAGTHADHRQGLRLGLLTVECQATIGITF